MSSRWTNVKPDPPEMNGDAVVTTVSRKKPDPPEMMNGIMCSRSRRTPSPATENISVALSMKFPLDFSNQHAPRFRHMSSMDYPPDARITNNDETATTARSLPFSPEVIGSSQWNSNNKQQRQNDVASQPESNMNEKVPASDGGTGMTARTTTPTRYIWAKESLEQPRRDSISVNDKEGMRQAEDMPAMARISNRRQQQQNDVAFQPESNVAEKVPTRHGTVMTTIPGNRRPIWAKESLEQPRRDSVSVNDKEGMRQAEDMPAMARISNKREQQQGDVAFQPESNMAEKVPTRHGTAMTTIPGNRRPIWAKESLEQPRRDSISVNDKEGMGQAEDLPAMARNSNKREQQQGDVAFRPESNMAEKVPRRHCTATTAENAQPIRAKEALEQPRHDSISVNDKDSVPRAEDIPPTAHISRKRQVIIPSYSLRKRPTKASIKGNPLSSFGSSSMKPGGKQVDALPKGGVTKQQTTINQTEFVANNKSRCAPVQGPVTNYFFHSHVLSCTESSLGIKQVMNFPQYFNQFATNGKRYCTMCGLLLPFVSRVDKATHTSMTIIPAKNKGVCTACDETVWKVLESDLIIKWCRVCRKFCPLAYFGERGMLKTCCLCREHSRETSRKYKLRIQQQSLESPALLNVTGKQKMKMDGARPCAPTQR